MLRCLICNNIHVFYTIALTVNQSGDQEEGQTGSRVASRETLEPPKSQINLVRRHVGVALHDLYHFCGF